MFQDLMVPLSELRAAIELLDREVQVYPIWICPFQLLSQPGLLRSPSNRDEMFVDIGIYGISQKVATG